MSEARVAIIGTDNLHAYMYAAFMNGWAESEPVPARLPNGTPTPTTHLWAALLRRLENDPSANVPVKGARVTSVWSADRGDAERLARACGIATVCERVEDACDEVDAVMVLSERPESHLPYARPALERGLPTYVDKPLAETPAKGREIFALAERSGARCFTGSMLRWSPDLLAARDYLQSRRGPIRGVSVQCPLDLELYGIHCVEMVNMFLGNDVASVEAIAGRDRQVVLLEYADSSAVFEHLRFLRWPLYGITFYAEQWHHRVVIEDVAPAALAFVERFVDFARGGPAPVTPEESLQLADIVTAARLSVSDRRRVDLARR